MEGQPFFPNGCIPEEVRLSGHVLHTGTSFQKPAAIHTFPSKEHRISPKEQTVGWCGDENSHNRNLIVMSKLQ